jgi:diacylglycerol kinase
MKNQKFSITQRLRSFAYAFNGLKILLKEEHNARLHLIAATVAVIAGVVLNISAMEWIAIVFATAFVITTEIINSSIENMADFISPEKHEKIKKIKDLAAAGVLISAVAALIVGMIIFLPKILEF